MSGTGQARPLTFGSCGCSSFRTTLTCEKQLESIVEGDFPGLETKWVQSQNLDFDQADWWRGWDVVFSIHCKRIFPPSILGLARFYNLHPGLNPHNRGWFPQVFHILNGLPIGATLHEIDAELDHGRIVGQTPIQTFGWDTSKTIYDRVLEAEIALMRDHLKSILEDDYVCEFPFGSGRQCELEKRLRFTLRVGHDCGGVPSQTTWIT